MSWLANQRKDVARALLGTWPSKVAAWGQEGIAAYVGELEARGLAADQALAALRSSRADWPPAVPELVEQATADPTRPSWGEAYRDLRRALHCRGAQRYHATAAEKEGACTAWLREHSHELVAAFFEAETYERLRLLPIDDPDYGQLEIERLRGRWVEFSGRAEERMARGLPAGSGARRQLGPRRPDFAGVLPAGPDPGGGA